MEQIHFHQLFQEIGTKLACPHCKQKISPLDLNLRNTTNNTCAFDAVCPSCGNIAHVSAVIEAQVTEEGQKMNASSRIRNSLIHIPISTEEIENAKNFLHQNQSIQHLFQS